MSATPPSERTRSSEEPVMHRSDLLPPRRRYAMAMHMRAASTHDRAAALHEAAAKLQEEHAVEMRELGRAASADRAERLAAREWKRAGDQRCGADLERRRAGAVRDGRPQQPAPKPIQ